MENKLTDEQKLEECRKFISELAYLGYNGSPFKEKQAKDLETQIQNKAWKEYINIFG